MFYSFYIEMIFNAENQNYSLVEFAAKEVARAKIPAVDFDIDDYPSPGLRCTVFFSLPVDSSLGRVLWAACNCGFASEVKVVLH